jgi:hypothetical protein
VVDAPAQPVRVAAAQPPQGAADPPAGVPDAGVPEAVGYPGDGAPRAQLAQWMATQAQKAGLPPELPVMASLIESGVRNLSGGDADSAGFFQMRVGVWDRGPYAGYRQRPDLQMKWFIDRALEVRRQRLAAGRSVTDAGQYGDWIADIERPLESLRWKYQTQLQAARGLLRG